MKNCEDCYYLRGILKCIPSRRIITLEDGTKLQDSIPQYETFTATCKCPTILGNGRLNMIGGRDEKYPNSLDSTNAEYCDFFSSMDEE